MSDATNRNSAGGGMAARPPLQPWVDCRLFTGYRPCEPFLECPCPDQQRIDARILIINLGALGHVLMTTTLLAALRRRWPGAAIEWVTSEAAAPLLQHNPLLHRVWTWSWETLLVLEQGEFDVVLNLDKDRAPAALACRLRARDRRGYGLDARGNIAPLSPAAEEAYRLGIDDQARFRRNRKTGPELAAESVGLAPPFERDRYVLELDAGERQAVEQHRRRVGGRPLVGLHTGCAGPYPNKKLTVGQHVALAKRLLGASDSVHVALLGGTAETLRNAEIGGGLTSFEDRVWATPTTHGIRRGLTYLAACDVVVTGDSMPLHAAIGLQRWAVAWFGVTCSQEIDLFGRGEKLSAELPCSPCWKRVCDRNLECRDQLDLERVALAVERGLAQVARARPGG